MVALARGESKPGPWLNRRRSRELPRNDPDDERKRRAEGETRRPLRSTGQTLVGGADLRTGAQAGSLAATTHPAAAHARRKTAGAEPRRGRLRRLPEVRRRIPRLSGQTFHLPQAPCAGAKAQPEGRRGEV